MGAGQGQEDAAAAATAAAATAEEEVQGVHSERLCMILENSGEMVTVRPSSLPVRLRGLLASAYSSTASSRSRSSSALAVRLFEARTGRQAAQCASLHAPKCCRAMRVLTQSRTEHCASLHLPACSQRVLRRRQCFDTGQGLAAVCWWRHRIA